MLASRTGIRRTKRDHPFRLDATHWKAKPWTADHHERPGAAEAGGKQDEQRRGRRTPGNSPPPGFAAPGLPKRVLHGRCAHEGRKGGSAGQCPAVSPSQVL